MPLSIAMPKKKRKKREKKRKKNMVYSHLHLVESRSSVDKTRYPTTWVKPLIMYLHCQNCLLGRIILTRCNATRHKCVILSFLFLLLAVLQGKTSKSSNSNEGSASLLVQTCVTHWSWESSTSLHQRQMPLKIRCICAQQSHGDVGILLLQFDAKLFIASEFNP